jgi:hypothetical protein
MNIEERKKEKETSYLKQPRIVKKQQVSTIAGHPQVVTTQHTVVNKKAKEKDYTHARPQGYTHKRI